MSRADNHDESIETTLSAAEKKVLKAFEGKEDKVLTPEDIFSTQEFSSQVEVMNAISWLRSKRLIILREIVRKSYTLSKEGKKFIAHGTPERIALRALMEKGEMKISELGSILGRNASIAVGWLRKKQWASIRKEKGETILSLTEQGKKDAIEEDKDMVLLKKLEPGIIEDEVPPGFDKALEALLSRKGVVKVSEHVIREATLTDTGKDIARKGIEIRPEVSAITPELIQSKKWREVDIRPYDIQAFAPRVRRGTLHPLSILMEEIREIFVSMGFEEIQGDYVESCFWNMDVLFIPQDHPARELQDTFYLKRPEKMELKDETLVETIRKIHEDGGDTGSTGW
ncbi:MAG: phenylalanine--tRNA ligase subunit alpha, partial [Thermoplasmata archaeon]|nr:phenylalanine--tRNA ligase subunit alpha [Thermoplasmata archaeon]